MSKIYAIIQDVVISSLEKGDLLPPEFTLELEDEHFTALLKTLVVGGTKTPVDQNLKRILLQIQDLRITVRSHLDPQDWFLDPAETVH